MSDFKAYLFGSVARGDHDPRSDVDVLLVYDNVPDSQLQACAKSEISSVMSTKCSFAEYSSGHLSNMFEDGDLFAWHLHLEAIPISVREDQGVFNCFPPPAPYRDGIADALNFSKLLASAQQSVLHNSKSLVFEAGIAYLALRNIGMALSFSVLRLPCFNRHAPFLVSAQLKLSPPCSETLYELLISARHASQRGLPEPYISAERLIGELELACKWTNKTIEVAREY